MIIRRPKTENRKQEGGPPGSGTKFVGSLFLPVFVLFFLGGQVAWAACPSFSELVYNGGYAFVYDGKLKKSCNLDQLFVPASILKIATSLAALHILGPDYRFATQFYLNSDGDLIIEGFGDPFLISEEVERIALGLREQGIEEIKNVVIDQGQFELQEQKAPGAGGSNNPYDAVNAAVAVNFNTLPLVVDRNGRVGSAEKQTPHLPLMDELGKKIKPGTHRINIDGQVSGSKKRATRYVGELLRAFLIKAGIRVTGGITRGQVSPEVRRVYTHHSPRLEEILQACLRYSNNFIANQVFLQCGTQRYGYPATWDKGRQAVREFFRTELSMGDDTLQIIEGSGLSRKNRLTVRAMLRILDAFAPYYSLLPEKKGYFVKSGTLTGVYNYAGFLDSGKNPVVILLNQKQNTRDQLLNLFSHEKDGK